MDEIVRCHVGFCIGWGGFVGWGCAYGIQSVLFRWAMCPASCYDASASFHTTSCAACAWHNNLLTYRCELWEERWNHDESRSQLSQRSNFLYVGTVTVFSARNFVKVIIYRCCFSQTILFDTILKALIFKKLQDNYYDYTLVWSCATYDRVDSRRAKRVPGEKSPQVIWKDSVWRDIEPMEWHGMGRDLSQGYCVTWHVNWVTDNHIFGIPDPDLCIYYTTSMGLRWRLRTVYWWASPIVKRFWGRIWYSGSPRGGLITRDTFLAIGWGVWILWPPGGRISPFFDPACRR